MVPMLQLLFSVFAHKINYILFTPSLSSIVSRFLPDFPVRLVKITYLSPKIFFCSFYLIKLQHLWGDTTFVFHVCIKHKTKEL